ncbi:MAG: LamG-like jellyroll fold domain-containing protein [Nonlabens sp.]|uniref:LamG-like jellyroll fold domain-containing protein n=1 Tax=Nonlabens sp. TaxID=1888209 RepID=UPI003EF5924D
MKNFTCSNSKFNFVFFLFFLYSFSSIAQTSQVTVSVNWPSWAGENYLRVYDPSGNPILSICDPSNCSDGANSTYSTTVDLGCLPNDNNYSVIMYDTWGDSWNGFGSNVTIVSGGNTVLNTSHYGGFNSTANFNVYGGGGVCTGGAQEIDIFGNGIAINDNDTTPALNDGTDLGTIEGAGTLSSTFTITNSGSYDLNLTGSPRVSITGVNAGDFSIVAQPTAVITGGNSQSFTVNFSRTTVGTSNARINISSDDTDEANYNFDITAQSVASLYTMYYENFDNGAGGWTSSNDGSFNWTLGTTFEKGEGNYWYTDSFDDFPKNKTARLTSPLISTLGYTNLKFYVDFRTNTNDLDDGMQIQYSANGGVTWNVLGSMGSGENWYNADDIDGISNNANGWAGDNSTLGSNLSRFEEASHELPAILENNPLVRFRVRFDSDNDNDVDDGVLIDNIIITGTPLVPLTATDGPADVNDNLTLWLRSQDIAQTDGSLLTTWNDLAIGNDAEEIAASAPTYANNVSQNINFNPTVNFDRSLQQHMRGKGGYNSNDYWVVVRSSIDMTNSLAGETVLLGAKCAPVSPSKDPSGLGWGPVSARFDNEVLAHCVGTATYTDNTNGYGRAFTDGSKSFDDVHVINVKNNPANNSTEIYLNGKRIDNTGARTITTDVINDFGGFTNRPFYIGAGRYQLNGLPYETHLNGQITEIFSYRDRLSETVQQRIYSYLAIKNGVSLQNPTSTIDDHRADWDYLDSDDNVIWDYSLHTNYNYDVAAIGRDDDSELNQKQSKSENSTSVVAIGLDRVEDLGTDNTSAFENDKDFLVWGHNGLDMNANSTVLNHDLGIANAVITNLTRVNRVWEISEVTGTDVPKTELRIATTDFAGLPALTPDSEYVLMIADDPNFTTNLETSFFNEDGSYQRASYNFDGTKYFTIGITYVTKETRSVVFDGIDDHIEIPESEGLGSNFTCSVWIYSDGANNTASNKTIVAKRSGNTGFQMYLRPDNRVTVWWNNGTTQEITSNTALNDNAWRHIAVAYDGTEVFLYIDGVLDNSENKTAPIADSNTLTIGARYEAANNIIEHWKGELDEIRMWEMALTVNQIRFIMNQELENNSDLVNGTVIPNTVTKNEIATINWDNLTAYYSMNSFIGTSLNDESVNKGYGRMANENFFELKSQTAPLPYVSTTNGNWEDQSSWENGNMLFTPGSFRNINGSTVKIDWNIVRSNHQLDILNTDVTLLGLMSESNQIDVENDHGLTITHHLQLDGIIDLKGESQLIQTADSDLVATSAGHIERDQQGTADKYNYNYWSSPVSTINNSSLNTGFNLNSVFKDGTYADTPRDLNWTNSSVRDGSPGTASTAATISGRWLYKYGNQAGGQYSNWQFINQNSNLNTGEGWTMKGTGLGNVSMEQNYVFVGKPNNGDIDLTINNGNDYLVGNPYPSALDAHEFINDNPNIDGTIYFWEHWGGNSHQLQLYQGGYAMYNLSGGLGNATFGTSHPSVNQGGVATKEPGRFIPVAQGFFVSGISNGTVKFRNDQRQFVKESSGNSIFVAAPGSNANNNPFSGYNTQGDTRPKFRIGFDSPNVIHRQLLLTIDPNASTGFDRAFDGYQYDSQEDDMSFKLGSEKLNIQGINQIDNTTILPLHVKLGMIGSITIKIDELENVDPTQGIYLKDAVTNTYHDLRNGDFVSGQLWAGNYPDRFFIVFDDPTTLSNDSVSLNEDDLIVYTPQGMNTLNIKKGVELDIETVSLTNMLGQEIKTWDVTEQTGIISVPVEQVASGNYIVTIATSYGIQTRKVIIE